MSIDEKILEACSQPLSIAQIAKRCALSRAAVAESVDRLRRGCRIRSERSSGGAQQWRTLPPAETTARLALRALMDELRRSVPSLELSTDLADAGMALAELLRLPDETRERIAGLADAHDAALAVDP